MFENNKNVESVKYVYKTFFSDLEEKVNDLLKEGYCLGSFIMHPHGGYVQVLVKYKKNLNENLLESN